MELLVALFVPRRGSLNKCLRYIAKPIQIFEYFMLCEFEMQNVEHGISNKVYIKSDSNNSQVFVIICPSSAEVFAT
jgi:hypothetical protein